jgi:hypothetical protein
MRDFQEDAFLSGLAMRSPSGNYSVAFLKTLQSAKLARITAYEF